MTCQFNIISTMFICALLCTKNKILNIVITSILILKGNCLAFIVKKLE